MKIMINFEEEEIQQALQNHFDTGKPVQAYVKAALNYFDEMLKAEKSGNRCGFGSKERFATYNTEVSPSVYLINKSQ